MQGHLVPPRPSWSNPGLDCTANLQFTRFNGRVIDLIPRVCLKIPPMFGPLKMAARPARGLSSNQRPAFVPRDALAPVVYNNTC